MNEERIDVPETGACPACGERELTLARDKVEYTQVTATPTGWAQRPSHIEDMESDDPLGNVRLFCPSCGTYFNVPEGL